MLNLNHVHYTVLSSCSDHMSAVTASHVDCKYTPMSSYTKVAKYQAVCTDFRKVRSVCSSLLKEFSQSKYIYNIILENIFQQELNN